MKFYEKYPQLKEKGFLAQMLTNTVFSTMSLENQQVSLPKVEEIIGKPLSPYAITKYVNELYADIFQEQQNMRR